MNRSLFISPARTNPEIAAAEDRLRGFQCEDRPGDPWAVPFDARAGQGSRPFLWSVIAGLFFLTLLIGAMS